jgi:hypothetical protein
MFAKVAPENLASLKNHKTAPKLTACPERNFLEVQIFPTPEASNRFISWEGSEIQPKKYVKKVLTGFKYLSGLTN